MIQEQNQMIQEQNQMIQDKKRIQNQHLQLRRLKVKLNFQKQVKQHLSSQQLDL